MPKSSKRTVCHVLLASVVFFLCTRLSVAQVTGEPTDAAAETVSNRPDVLACCAANGVPAFCQLKICTYDPDLFSTESTNSTLCAITYFDKAVTCFADGRDHSSCCRSRGVAHECVKYCDLSLLVPKQECITEFDKIKLCFEENYEILPGPPINIAASNITGFSAMISWDKPARLGDSVTSYSISYKDILRSPTFRNTAEPYVTVHNVSSPHALAGLAGDSLHKVYMIAYNAHGSSLPSDILQFRTQELQPYGNNTIPLTSLLPVEHSGEIPVLPDEIDVPPIDAPSHNVSACCIQRNVSARCHHLCSYDATASEISRIRALCADDLDTLFECWSDGRDHRQCCRDRGMVTRCVEACGGERLHNIHRQRCNNVSADILQCFEEGLDILPKRPERVRVEELNSTWLQLAWNPPRDSPGNITQYNVFHYHGNSATQPDSGAFMYVTIPPVTTSYMFTGLQPGQMYVLHVQSMNAHGTSLPSYALEVWTPPLEDSDHNLSPRRLQLIDAGVGNLTVTWQPPIKQLPVHYIVHYKQVSLQPSSNVSALNDTAWYQVKLAGYRTNLTIDNLDQDTKYDIYVSAINSEQRVADSPHILSRTIAKKSPRVRIVAILPNKERVFSDNPGSVLQVAEYTRVELRCRSWATPVANVTLLHNNATLMQAVDSVILPILLRRHDIGKLKCYADNGVPPRRHANLPVRVIFGPEVSSVKEQVAKSIGELGRLKCIISVFPPAPDGAFIWEYQSKVSPRWQRVRDDDRRHVALRSTDVPYQQNFELRIRAVQDVDLGLYRCVDVTGKNSASVYLSVDDATPAPAKDPRNFQQCCRELGIHVNCIPACSYDWWLSPSELPRDVLEGCLSGDDNFNLVKLVTCAADGKNHEPCCARKGVPDSCLPFCRGAIPPSNTTDFRHCLVYYEKMATCMKEGNSVLPGPPTQLIGEPVQDNMVRLHWDAPLHGYNSDRVTFYQVLYRMVGDAEFTRLPRNITSPSWSVSGLKPSTQFEFMVQAGNEDGVSQPSAVIQVATGTDTIPAKPHRSRGNPHWVMQLAVGLVVGAIVIIVIVAAVLFLLRRQRRAKESAGSVTFENPGYDKNADESAENGGHGNGNADGWFRPELTTGTTDDEAVIVENSYPVDRSQSIAGAQNDHVYESVDATAKQDGDELAAGDVSKA